MVLLNINGVPFTGPKQGPIHISDEMYGYHHVVEPKPTMTIGQMIEELSGYDPDLPVFLENGYAVNEIHVASLGIHPTKLAAFIMIEDVAMKPIERG
ncbi:MAG: hypothetical protein JKY54_02220 [Flavobacteriales bacterium]|nr:hypothetical protein [Flavobacteriales bacterium]